MEETPRGLMPKGAESYALMSASGFPSTPTLPRSRGMVKNYSLCMALETAIRTDGYHALIRGLDTA
ncbi:hypothetical protein PARU111607_17350 [Palleronia rufa]